MAPPPFVTNLFVQDIDKNLEYFTNTLGFRETERMSTPDGKTVVATLQFGNGTRVGTLGLASIPTMMQNNEGPQYDFGTFGQNVRNSPQTLGNGVVLYFAVPNVDKLYEKIRAKGALIDEPPTTQFWGERTISVNTPDGYYMTFATPVKGWKPPPESGIVVSRPKATRRTGGAKAKAKGGRTAKRGRGKA